MSTAIKDQIEKQLKAKKMSQKDLANRLETEPSNFNKRLNGGTMRIGELERACEILDLRIKLHPNPTDEVPEF